MRVFVLATALEMVALEMVALEMVALETVVAVPALEMLKKGEVEPLKNDLMEQVEKAEAALSEKPVAVLLLKKGVAASPICSC